MAENSAMTESARPAKRVKFDFSATFDVLVGPRKKKFTLYHDLFTRRSKFLHASRSSQWLTDSTKPTDLTDHDPAVFSIYLQCVYTGEIVILCPQIDEWCAQGRSDDEDEHKDEVCSYFRTLIKLYSCSDKLEDLTTMNLAIDEIIRFSDRVNVVPTSPTTLHLAYERTPASSPLRRLIRNYVLFEAHVDQPYFDDDVHELSVDLLADVVKEYHVIKKDCEFKSVEVWDAYRKQVSEFAKCHYYSHNDEHPACDAKQ